MAIKRFYRLSNQLNTFCGENDLPHLSADELLHEEITLDQRKWLYKFIYRWNKACERQNA
jgi:hypothetical protein